MRFNHNCTPKNSVFHFQLDHSFFFSPFQEQQRQANKQHTNQRQQLFQLRSIKASIKQQEMTTKDKQKERLAKKEAQKALPRRLGKLKYALHTFLTSVSTC